MFITSHHSPDIDALLSAALLSHRFDYPIIFYDLPDHNARVIAEIYGIKYEVDPNCSGSHLLVDTHNSPFKGGVIKVYDHHNCTSASNEMCDDNSPSTAYMLYKSLDFENKFPFNEWVILSIISDSHRFKDIRKPHVFRDVSVLLEKTRRSYNELLSLIDFNLNYSERLVLARSFSREYHVYRNSKNKYILVITQSQGYQSIIANSLISGLNSDVAFAYSIVDGELRLSARASPRFKMDLSKIVRDIALQLGGIGGGHPYAAAANLPISAVNTLRSVILATLEKHGLIFTKD